MRIRHLLIAAGLGIATGMALFYCFDETPTQQRHREPSSVSTTDQPAQEVTCRMKTGDVGEITGQGPDKNTAFADAAEKCYLKREALFEKHRKKSPGLNQGEDMVISCVNLSCAYEVSSL